MKLFFTQCQWDSKYAIMEVMTATSHAILGTVIAAKITNPAFAIPLAFLSHIAADIIPHWDTATNRDKKGKDRVLFETVLDVVFGFIISYLLVVFAFPQTNLLYCFFLVFVAQALDWIMAPYYFFNIKTAPFTWAYRFQKLFDNTLDAPWGIVTQVVVILAVLVLSKLI